MGPAVKLYAQWKPITAQIIDSNGTSAVREYISLADAVEAYDGNGYIKMTANTEEPGFTLGENLYLDLNGKTVTLTSGLDTGSYKLYGMDSTTDNYDGTTPGKLDGTVTGNVALVHETSAKKVDGYDSLRYVAIKNEEGTEYTFHRFNISVTGYRFELTTGDTPKCALFFIGKFQGDKAAKDYLTSLGFTLDGLKGSASKKVVTCTMSTALNKEVVVDENGAYCFEAYLMREIDKSNPNTYQNPFSATAQATFNNGGTQQSDPQNLSFQDAWTEPKGYKNLTPKQQEILNRLLTELDIPIPK